MLCACLFFNLIILLNRRTNTESSANDDSDYEVDRAMRSHDNSTLSNDQIPFLCTFGPSRPLVAIRFCSASQMFKYKFESSVVLAKNQGLPIYI